MAAVEAALIISQARDLAMKGGRWTGAIALLIWAYALVAGVAFGGVLSAILGFVAGVMAWTPAFTERRAQGLPTLSDPGRIAAGLVCLIGSLALLPSSAETANGSQQASPEATPLRESAAFETCKEAVLDRLTHPSTADFSIFGIGFQSYPDGTAILGTTFTARNGFNLEIKYEAACDFIGTELTDVKIVEAR